LQALEPDHYATLGLDRCCTDAQIRAAYRVLARQFHPDLNNSSLESVTRTQALNVAYEILSNPELRKEHDHQLAATATRRKSPGSKLAHNISQDVHLRLEEFFRGAVRDVRVNDLGNPSGVETYELKVPPETAVGTRFRLRRDVGGAVILRALAMPHFQYKVRGADLRCDLKINFRKAALGGEEILTSPAGNRLQVKFPAGIARGEIVRISGEGMPKARGGRGDLLLRIMYQPEVRVSRRA
jgi:curved DNA-binding protein